jgi:hypothetical protein
VFFFVFLAFVFALLFGSIAESFFNPLYSLCYSCFFFSFFIVLLLSFEGKEGRGSSSFFYTFLSLEPSPLLVIHLFIYLVLFLG